MTAVVKTLTINGQRMDVPEGTTIATFLDAHNLQPKSVVVEVNRIIVDREKFAETILNEGDTVEIVRFIGGG